MKEPLKHRFNNKQDSWVFMSHYCSSSQSKKIHGAFQITHSCTRYIIFWLHERRKCVHTKTYVTMQCIIGIIKTVQKKCEATHCTPATKTMLVKQQQWHNGISMLPSVSELANFNQALMVVCFWFMCYALLFLLIVDRYGFFNSATMCDTC